MAINNICIIDRKKIKLFENTYIIMGMIIVCYVVFLVVG